MDDKHVVKHIWYQHYHEPPPFSIKHKGGIEELLKSIPVELGVEKIQALGIMIDANDDPNKRWKQLVNRISRIPLHLIPEIPEPDGTIIKSQPRLGVWMMPDNQSSGEIETFIRQLIPNDDQIWPRSKRYVEDIPDKYRKFKPRKELKAKIHAWLAVREKPRPMGVAIKTGDLDTDALLAIQFYE
ncbi:MAG: hypothetical protein OXF06_11360 [Bacteroidetes bacterium]|nr:hypothetical protein [Bacteroidota bacterium]